MLTTLAISNYRSLRKLVAPLERLNVITGANGSGKSNLYRALRISDVVYNQFIAMKKLRWMASLLGLAALPSLAQPEPRRIEGTYRNPALGYSVKVPRGLKAIAGDEVGPERGVRISLPSGGELVVFGEPNSLEWKSPEEGVRMGIPHSNCTTDRQQIRQAKVGQLNGAEASLVCGDRVFRILLAFRKGGGPIYWLRLETVRSHQSEDEAILKDVADSLRQIHWE